MLREHESEVRLGWGGKWVSRGGAASQSAAEAMTAASFLSWFPETKIFYDFDTDFTFHKEIFDVTMRHKWDNCVKCLSVSVDMWNFYTPRNEVRGGILESPCPSVCLSVCPSVCRRARLGKIVRLGIGCRGGYFVPLGRPHSSLLCHMKCFELFRKMNFVNFAGVKNEVRDGTTEVRATENAEHRAGENAGKGS